ncbi:ribosomal RNA small subunit methyltransferase A [Candidatus Nomurabacteria bacterium RIFCSPLOWO2_01_FULL_46_18]|uniref:Ribosomal RNA small subunit methyltransferase A n=1 Tax=Candidatus Nomurabacteria bacterium RIFCSPLOWO2_01_FULL_46_18 TaxID=1801783 RepID=A0A1F6XEW3_9BACT|nr:MAG: ribosomal RNA small subunit methyltransferase A [Candidatus Nomurabacteria bacterium RIFCSPLOWO2_01_FULL_46_18]
MMKPRKSLGQHFLKSKDALRKIIQAGQVSSDDVILEIGPGRGALTKQLLAFGCQVLAVEKDKELVQYLQEKFQNEIKSGKLKLIEDDILNFDFKTYNLEPRTYKLISNIPYNITGAILKKFLSSSVQPERMVLLVQKEVAERIMGYGPRRKVGVNKESILSISVKAYGEPKVIDRVPRRYFSPEPKVDSAIIAIKNISREFFNRNDINEEKFWQIVKKGFAHKRKKLAGNLKNVIPDAVLAKYSDKRAEDLTLDDWIGLVSN